MILEISKTLHYGLAVRFLLVVSIACAMSSSSFAAEAETAAKPSSGQLTSPEWIAAGRAHFVQACSYCHGEEGDAGKTIPFRDHHNWDPQDIHDTIAEGKQTGANIMPSWKDSISDNDIWRFVAFIKSLEGKKGKQQ